MRALIGLALLGLVPLACHKADSEPPAPLTTASAAPAVSIAPLVPAVDSAVAADSAAAVATATAAKVPTPADFEVQATSTITAANAGQALSQLDKEIGK